MKKFIENNMLYFVGALLGCLAGFLYWKFVGCINGTCAITSNPILSTIYGAVMGSLLLSIFKKSQKQVQYD